jgi:hypothetical protein
VRSAAVLTLVGAVLAASALDLAVGALWVVALLGVWLLRRRIRLAAPLVLVTSVALMAAGIHLGWLSRPAPAPYSSGWLPAWVGASPEPGRAAAPASEADPRIVAARDRLRVLEREELRLTGAEIEQRAGAVIRLARRLDGLGREASREVAAVEAAARGLARTLAAPEFRDLEARRGAAAAYLGELGRRLTSLRDADEAAEVLRAADPAAMAHVSLRPVRDDLLVADATITALARALGGGAPSATAAAAARFDEGRGEVAWEVRHAIAGAPGLRLLRVETRAFRSAGVPGRPLSLAYAPGDEAPRPVPPGAWVELDPAPRSVSLVAAWSEPARSRPVRSLLRPITFQRLEIAPFRAPDDAVVVGVLDGRPGIELPLTVTLPPPSLARVVLPGQALHFASWPGSITREPDGDAWVPEASGSGRLELDLVPRTLLLRNRAFAWIRDYVYRPNPTTVIAVIGLAALALVLVRRPRPAAPDSR